MDTQDSQLCKTIQARLLEMFKFFTGFLKAHGITCYSCGGTTLGAVRHHGFIPWDDDLDLYLFRSDYDKLIALNSELEKEGYSFVCIEHDEYYFLPFGKLIDLSTSLWEMDKHPFMIGLYIDVFPLDCFNKDDASLVALVEEAKCRMERLSVTNEQPRPRRIVRDILYGEWKNAFTRLRYFFPKLRQRYHKRYYQELLSFYDKVRGQDGDKCVCLAWNELIFKKQWYLEAQESPFEDTSILIPKDYDAYLTLLYGDYMTPPPPSQRNSVHGYGRLYLNLKERITIEEARVRLKNHESLVL